MTAVHSLTQSLLASPAPRTPPAPAPLRRILASRGCPQLLSICPDLRSQPSASCSTQPLSSQPAPSPTAPLPPLRTIFLPAAGRRGRGRPALAPAKRSVKNSGVGQRAALVFRLGRARTEPPAPPGRRNTWLRGARCPLGGRRWQTRVPAVTRRHRAVGTRRAGPGHRGQTPVFAWMRAPSPTIRKRRGGGGG